MMWFQFTANTGPLECALAVRKALALFYDEATTLGLCCSVLEQIPGPEQTLQSVLVEVCAKDGVKNGAENGTKDDAANQDDSALQTLKQRWQGTLQWKCTSPFRPMHPRKNWFVGVAVYTPPAPIETSGIRFETCRASGAGGQHVNTTDSAVRAIHIATGISVRVEAQRSQFANKKLALRLLAAKLAAQQAQQETTHKHTRFLQHRQVVRGDPVRVFSGMHFKEIGR